MRVIALWLALALVVGGRGVHNATASAVRWLLDEVEAIIRRALDQPAPAVDPEGRNR